MADFEPVLSRNWNVADSHTLKVYESRGGYQASRKALTTMDPDAVVNLVKDSELRGRGGAGFPCGLKWSSFPRTGRKRSCASTPTRASRRRSTTAPDGEGPAPVPRGDPDRLLRHQGDARRTSTSGSSTSRPTRSCEAAIAEARAAGHLGKNIYGTGFDLDIWVHRGAGAYICGEETGLIESLEGKRGWPRIKPPFPAIEGAFRKPTVVNNVETLCCVPHIIERGRGLVQVDRHAQELRARSSTASPATSTSQVCVELPLGITCRAADRRARRRRLEGPQGQGRRAGRDQHGPALGRRARHPARLREPAQARLPRPGHRRRDRDRRPDRASSTTSTTPAGSSPTRAAASARPAARGPAGCTR